MNFHASCPKHDAAPLWIVCIHEQQIQTARRRAELSAIGTIAGEALCPECRAWCERIKTPGESLATLRIACETCVLERWPVEGAS